MDLPINTFKHALSARKRQIGLWNSLCSPTAVELLADVGFDWMLLDTEHSPNELPDILSQLRAMHAASAHAVVRPAWNDPVLIKRLLDIGVQSLLVPFVQDGEEAARAVAAVRYPPHGIRGVSVGHRANRYGRVPDYHSRAAGELCVIVQIETRRALERIEEIAAVEGVDGVFIGPSDLAADLGHLGNPAHGDVQEAIGDGCRRAGTAGKPVGILAPVVADARRYLEMGYTFVAVGSDLGVLRRGAENLLGEFD